MRRVCTASLRYTPGVAVITRGRRAVVWFNRQAQLASGTAGDPAQAKHAHPGPRNVRTSRNNDLNSALEFTSQERVGETCAADELQKRFKAMEWCER